MQVFTSKTHEVRNTHVNDGGGGGGGATYVFLVSLPNIYNKIYVGMNNYMIHYFPIA